MKIIKQETENISKEEYEAYTNEEDKMKYITFDFISTSGGYALGADFTELFKNMVELSDISEEEISELVSEVKNATADFSKELIDVIAPIEKKAKTMFLLHEIIKRTPDDNFEEAEVN